MPKIVGLNRRAFIKNAGVTALAGAAGTIATGANTAAAQDSSSTPRMAGGKYDLATTHKALDGRN